MKAIPGTLQAGGASFRTTHWSVITDCALADEAGFRALEQLGRVYWPPLSTFARRRGYSSTDAQDLVQGFFAHFLGRKAYARADRSKRKFRSFMLASIETYMANLWDHEHALKRGGNREFVLLDEEVHAAEELYTAASINPGLDEEQNYEKCWAISLVSCALARLGKEFAGETKERIFSELKPFLCGGAALPNQLATAERLEMPTNTLRSHLLRLRGRMAKFCRKKSPVRSVKLTMWTRSCVISGR